MEDREEKCKRKGEMMEAEASKRRRISCGCFNLSSSPGNSTSPDSDVDNPGEVIAQSCSTLCSDHKSISRSSTGLVIHMTSNVTDLKESADFKTDQIAMFTDDNFSRDMSPPPTSELCSEDTQELALPAKPLKQHPRRRSPVANMLIASEIEEFFAEAEKYEAKRFAERYNYDVVRDVPLEGRYQWILLKQQ